MPLLRGSSGPQRPQQPARHQTPLMPLKATAETLLASLDRPAQAQSLVWVWAQLISSIWHHSLPYHQTTPGQGICAKPPFSHASLSGLDTTTLYWCTRHASVITDRRDEQDTKPTSRHCKNQLRSCPAACRPRIWLTACLAHSISRLQKLPINNVETAMHAALIIAVISSTQKHLVVVSNGRRLDQLLRHQPSFERQPRLANTPAKGSTSFSSVTRASNSLQT